MRNTDNCNDAPETPVSILQAGPAVESQTGNVASRNVWMRNLACLVAFAVLTFSIGVSHGQQGNGGQFPMKDTSGISPLSRQSNDANGRIDEAMRPGEEEKRMEALNALRQKEMTADTAKLLALATELKAQMDKTDKDMLSLDVIRKAEQIEKLARSVREKMKQSITK